MSERFDLIVIGAGSAARDAANTAAHKHGARVALIEKERWGGSCPNVACQPTKAYLVAAELAHDVNALAPRIGVEAGRASVDLARLYAWKQSLKKPQEQWVEELRAKGYATYTGEATLLDARRVQVGEDVLEADRILIASGSRTAVPPIEGLEEVGWLDHVSALELTELPESLLVVGGGAVGLEFGQMFTRFGSRVTIVDAADRIAPASDAEASATLAASLADEGLTIATSVFVKRVRRESAETVALIAPRDDSDEYEVGVAQILLASGRVPNLEGLNVEALGIETTKAGITVDEHLRTSVRGIWAAGDVTAIAQLTPVAQYQSRIAVADMFEEDGPAADYSVLPTAIFTDPELGGVGLTEDEAREQGLDVGTVTNDHVRRFSFIEAKHGLFKIVFDRSSRRVLGLHVVSRNAGDIVQGFSIGLRLGATVEELAAMHHVFPTFGEGIKAAAEQAAY
jgi:pyruvate/2-oxoglutarate dehydrogenase complex dihydrolipoamide dehydrogenase (E3) component